MTTTASLEPGKAEGKAAIEAALLDAEEAAAYCGMSRAAWYKRNSSGEVPRSVKIGGLSRWRRDELAAWIEAGCPIRGKWDVMRAKNKSDRT